MNDQPSRAAVIAAGICFALWSGSAISRADSEEAKSNAGAAGKEGKKGIFEGSQLAAHVGYTQIGMTDFDRTERSRGNKTISDGLSVNLELSFAELTIPQSVPLLSGIRVRVPVLGGEYLRANASTLHVSGGNSATVEWSLPVVGAYLAPAEFAWKSAHWLKLRPIEVGYYRLAPHADLTVSDRPGRLNLTSQAVGLKTELIAVKSFADNTVDLSVSAGYRWLRFTNVAQDPKGGFLVSAGGAAAASGNLQDSLDYNGAFLLIGLAMHF